ncbi:unnamed protein product [Mycena citricolor]|uniref:Peptidase A1 domain-containing protein n=1 Tax=Mycena citricolor TaxID=2018698 RepID=A0AAD2JUK6_9AGAR|nr:unnamed protein product [Mycena citricolor]
MAPPLVTVLLVLPLIVSALRLDVTRSRPTPGVARSNGLSKVSLLATTSGSNSSSGLSTVRDLIYMANVSIGNNFYPMQLDTGSSDVWVKPAITPLPNAISTAQTYNLTYGIGWVSGNVSFAPITFAGINVSSQALLDVTSANNPALQYGADGLLGLGFTSMSSIDHLLNQTGQTTGRSFLFNLFLDNPSEPNYIAFSLQRSTDSSDTVLGSFSIGEVEPAYTAVLNTTQIPTWPTSYPKRWNVLVEALIIASDSTSHTVIPNTTVANAPSNRAVALLDSGTSYSYATTEICDAIYGSVGGAHFDSDLSQWVVPCDAEIDIALQIAGQVFPLHPLDVTTRSLVNASVCVGSFIPQTVSVGAGEFDFLLGDSVLRSLYAVYDFGDFDKTLTMGDPYVQLLSLVDPTTASKDFHAARGGVAITNITYNAANSSPGSASSVTISGDLNNTLNKIVTYLPAMLGIMALNAAVLLALIVFGVVYMCRNRQPRATARKNRGRATPLPMNPRNSYIAGADPQPHAYQPVSMAITEDFSAMRPMSMNPRDSFAAGVPMADRAPVSMAIEDDMFIPPSPQARAFKSSGLRHMDRPVSTVEEQPFTAPSQGASPFAGDSGDLAKRASYQRHASEDSLVAPSIQSRSAGNQRSPSEEDSVFVSSPTAMASEGVSLPPPLQPEIIAPAAAPAQFPPPPSRQSPSRQPPPVPPARQIPAPSRQDSVQLSDDQFAGNPAPIPRRRQASNSSGLFVPREYTGRPGDRPQSFVSSDVSGLNPPSPAFHSDGGRPKSIA